MKFFNKDGLFHWLIQRISAIFMVFLVIFLVNNVFSFSLLLIALCFHLFAGIQTLFDDYIHNTELFFFCFLFLRVLFLFLIKIILIIFL